MSGFTIVVSDLHLGAPHSVLNTSTQWNPSEVDAVVHGTAAREVLYDAIDGLAGGATLARVVMLGDVIDLSHGLMEDGLAELETFLTELTTGRVVEELVFVPGNHDRHWWTLQCEYLGMTKGLADGVTPVSSALTRTTSSRGRTGDIDLIAGPMRRAVPGLSVRVAYPDLLLTLGPKKVRLHHGHLIGPLWTLLYHVLASVRRDLVEQPLARARDPIQDPTRRQRRILGSTADVLGDPVSTTLDRRGGPIAEVVERVAAPFIDLDWLFTGQTGLLARFGASDALGRALMRVLEGTGDEDRDERTLTGLFELILLGLQDEVTPARSPLTGERRLHSYSNNALKTQAREIGEAIARGVVSASRSDEDRDVRIGAIEKDLDRIRRYMELFGNPDPDVFIFGHTHISGAHRAGGTTYLNTGGWVTSGGRAPDATVVALDDRGRESFARVNLSR